MASRAARLAASQNNNLLVSLFQTRTTSSFVCTASTSSSLLSSASIPQRERTCPSCRRHFGSAHNRQHQHQPKNLSSQTSLSAPARKNIGLSGRSASSATAAVIAPDSDRDYHHHDISNEGLNRDWLSPPTHGSEFSDPPDGPIAEYNRRVRDGQLTNDAHQRSIITNLQVLYDTLKSYTPPTVTSPTKVGTSKSIFSLSRFFPFASPQPEATGSTQTSILDGTPKGVYMFGDVGSGKTMLMDLFYYTLPEHLHSRRTRVHFNNFMQDVHKSLHKHKMQSSSYSDGDEADSIAAVAYDIARESAVLCFDEFQCTDIADAMILRRLLEGIMSHGVVIVTTSNRQPDELYKNGIQRQSFVPAIELLKTGLNVINLDSPTDYRRVARPGGVVSVYHSPSKTPEAKAHADSWFNRLGDFTTDPPHPATLSVWGRPVEVPLSSGRAAMFEFDDLIGAATGAADYIELCRHYDSFVITNVPIMGHYNNRHLARRFITFIDAVYESRGVLILTTERPVSELLSDDVERGPISKKIDVSGKSSGEEMEAEDGEEHHIPSGMRALMDDLGMDMAKLKESSIFTGDEETFAFDRALSRLSEMSTREWVERR